MVDQFDLEILKVIENALSIVRSVTVEEIERGVLFPSISTIDIKRNLPFDVDLDIVEGRLKALENDGYIVFEMNRWWLTPRGRKTLGKTDTKAFQPVIPPSKPMREILEETFSRFESIKQETKTSGSILENIDDTRKKIIQAKAFLSELSNSYEAGLISEMEYRELVEKLSQKLIKLDVQIEAHFETRRNEILKEIEELENEIAKKRVELETLNRAISRKLHPKNYLQESPRP